MAFKSFEDLEVWKKAYNLAINIYRIFSHCKDYGLKDQITRAAISIPSNIAEGCERDSKKDFVRFLNIAKGSAAELKTQLYIAKGIDIIAEDDFTNCMKELKNISAMLYGLIKSIKMQKTEHRKLK